MALAAACMNFSSRRTSLGSIIYLECTRLGVEVLFSHSLQYGCKCRREESNTLEDDKKEHFKVKSFYRMLVRED